jgi:hypothetical protein
VKKEGGFNRVFVLMLDLGHCVIMRLPIRIASLLRLTTNSKVAIIEYCMQDNICVKIITDIVYSTNKDINSYPKGSGLECNLSNIVGLEYIIEEHVEGTPLHKKWPSMNMHQHMLCTKAVSLQVKEMALLKLPAFGSLYFLDAPIDETKKILIDDIFCTGPHCSPVFWNCNPGELELYGGLSPNCGPYELTIG